MLRLILLALALCAVVYLLIRLCKELSQQDVDWRGVGVASGFVVLAIYLRSMTDIGGLV